MCSHDNIYWTALITWRILGSKEGKDVVVSYLPLSHVAGQMWDIWFSLSGLYTVAFADKMALKGTLLNTLKEARPTLFLGVPRVYEKIMEGMKEKGKATKGLKKKLVTACKVAALEYHVNKNDTLMYRLGKKTIYKKVREAIGLDRCRILYSGAAPNSQETLKYFLSLDMSVYDLYGMTETTGPHTGQGGLWGREEKINVGSVGKTYPGCMTKLVNQDVDGVGEICMTGRNQMMGYFNREDKTEEAVDQCGWLHSEDMGRIDENGYIFVTG